MLVIVDYKGKRIKKYFKLDNEELKRVYILITDKQNKNNYNYNFICILENNHVLIPETSLIPKETGYIHLTFKGHKFNIPIHAIYSLGYDLPTTLNFNIDFNV